VLPVARTRCWRKKSLRAAEQDRPEVARNRRRWRVWQRCMDPERFVILDERSATTNMTPLRRGTEKRAPGRCQAWGIWQTTTFVAGLLGPPG
jgi:hypothetical protein